MELGYVGSEGRIVIVDTLAWRTLYPGILLNVGAGTLSHLTHAENLERRKDVTIRVSLHRRGWARRGEDVLRSTRAIWYRGGGLDLFVGPNARSIRAPWRGELAKVRKPYGALAEQIKDSLERAAAHPGSPSLVWLDRSTVHGCTRTGRTVIAFATERKEFSGFILGKLSATIEFASESDANAFCDGLPFVESPSSIEQRVAPDITRSKRIRWTPGVFAIVVGGLAFYGFVISGTIVGALEGNLTEAAKAAVEIAVALSLVSWAMPQLLRMRRREFVDLLNKWPRVLCERWGGDYQAQAAKASDALRGMGVRADGGGVDLAAVDAFLRSLPPETCYGTFALQIGLLGIDRLLRIVARPVEFSWEYLSDRHECAFRVDAAGLRLYPLTAVLAVWRERDPEGLDPFIRTYARELQMRLAFSTTARPLVALGMTAQQWEAFPRFSSRLEGELRGRSRDRTQTIDGRTVRERVLDYGAVQIVVVEESLGGDSAHLAPAIAFPRASASGRVLARYDRDESDSEYLVLLRVGARELPLMAWTVPGTVDGEEGTNPQEVEVSAIIGSGRIVRDLYASAVPDIAPLEPDEDEPRTSLVSLRARVTEVSEGTNDFTGSKVWILTLDFGDVRVPAVAARDLWINSPAPGDAFIGTAWVSARRPEST